MSISINFFGLPGRHFDTQSLNRGHWSHLQCELEKRRRAKSLERLHKCGFLKDNVYYLGFEASVDGMHTSLEGAKSILD